MFMSRCDFKTDLPWQMSDHDSTHSVKGYSCQMCDYKTTRIMFLRRHMKVGGNTKNYSFKLKEKYGVDDIFSSKILD